MSDGRISTISRVLKVGYCETGHSHAISILHDFKENFIDNTFSRITAFSDLSPQLVILKL